MRFAFWRFPFSRRRSNLYQTATDVINEHTAVSYSTYAYACGKWQYAVHDLYQQTVVVRVLHYAVLMTVCRRPRKTKYTSHYTYCFRSYCNYNHYNAVLMPLCCPKCTFILSPSDDSLEQSYVCNSCQSGPFTKCDQCDTLFLICRRLSWKLKRHASNVHKDIHRDDSQPIDQNELDEDKSIHSQQFDRSHHAHFSMRRCIF